MLGGVVVDGVSGADEEAGFDGVFVDFDGGSGVWWLGMLGEELLMEGGAYLVVV